MPPKRKQAKKEMHVPNTAEIKRMQEAIKEIEKKLEKTDEILQKITVRNCATKDALLPECSEDVLELPASNFLEAEHVKSPPYEESSDGEEYLHIE